MPENRLRIDYALSLCFSCPKRAVHLSYEHLNPQLKTLYGREKRNHFRARAPCACRFQATTKHGVAMSLQS